MAQLDYQSNSEIHLGILRRIYRVLCPDMGWSQIHAFGAHWERIGFQGLDPSTDINRSMKMFAILQVLHFVDASPGDLCFQAFKLSTNFEKMKGLKIDNSWPFFVTSIGFTKEAIQALRRGDLNSKCNKRKDVLSVVHDFHHGCFLEFIDRLRASPNVHMAEHLAKVRDLCAKKPSDILKNYKSYVASAGARVDHSNVNNNNSNNSSGIGSAESSGRDFKFDDLDKINDDQEDVGKNSLLTSVGIGKASKFVAK